MSDSAPFLRAEAEDLRRRVAELRAERDRLAAECQRWTERYESEQDGAAHGTQRFDDATESHRTLVSYKERLGRVTDQLADAQQRLGELTKVLEADPTAALQAARAARAKTVEAERKVEVHAEAIARLQGMVAAEKAAAETARAAQVAEAVASLPAEARGLLGITSDTSQPAGDPAVHERKAQALAEAVARAEQIGEELQRALEDARRAEDQAVDELLQARALRSEATLAAAIAAFVPVWIEHTALHEAAFGIPAQPPDLKSIARTSRAEAAQAARAAALRDLDEGALRRGLRRLVGG